MFDESQITIDTSIDALENTLEIPFGEIEDPEENIVTTEQASLSASPL
jgi:hypothetical protein